MNIYYHARFLPHLIHIPHQSLSFTSFTMYYWHTSLLFTILFVIMLAMFTNPTQNLCVCNRFTLGPNLTLPCLQLGCHHIFKNRSGHKTHILAAHPNLNHPANFLMPEITPSSAEPSFDFQASFSQYWSSSPVGGSAGSDIQSDPSEAWGDGYVSMQEPELANVEFNPSSPLVTDEGRLLPLAVNGSPSPSISHDFPIPSVCGSSQPPMASFLSQSSLPDCENIPHGSERFNGDLASAACDPPHPSITCIYHRQMNGMLFCA